MTATIWRLQDTMRREANASAARQLAVRHIIEATIAAGLDPKGVCVMPEGVWEPGTKKHFAHSLAKFRGEQCWVSEEMWNTCKMKSILGRKYSDHGRLGLEDLTKVAEALMKEFEIEGIPEFLKRKRTAETDAAVAKHVAEAKERREGRGLKNPPDAKPIAGDNAPVGKVPRRTPQVAAIPGTAPLGVKKAKAPTGDLANKQIVLGRAIKRQPGAARTVRWEAMKAYVAKHPKATLSEITEKTPYTFSDYKMDVERGALK